MSPILFDIVLEKVIRKIKFEPQEGSRLMQSTVISLLTYLDDIIVLMEESQGRLKKILFIYLLIVYVLFGLSTEHTINAI